MKQRNWKRVFFCTHSFGILPKLLSVSVHVASKNEKRKGWNHMCWTVIINHLWRNIDKKRWNKTSFFPEKNSSLNKTLNVWNENILHPRKINVKCYIFFNNIKFTDVKKKYNSKYFSIFFMKHFQTLSWHAPSRAPACSP